ncbi:glycosyl transferase family 4 [Desulfomicrobium baculatum DSM 4028]|uniref:Glycosyl transferase family 4 n=1 Tax=Desulfomicrobium baculatum (strain DSM 4028 / VKM B-1378 / X) TaxID=525897 RepID=C7LP25_DESBD|nr:glycosyl transferase family 4 [Desulfomicrobium baculatum DSM 4028]
MTGAALYFLTGLLLSIPCCILVPRYLTRAGFLDLPGERSSHVRPTPKGGGVGLVVAFVWVAVVIGLPLFFWLPLLALAILSFVNDLRSLSAGVRLAAQFMAALLVLGGALWAGHISWPAFLILPALFFVVATTNCYNFMDGINGLAGITAVVAFACLLVFGGAAETPLFYPIVAVMGALLGFLPFNLPRARLFMGDVGSIFLGFLFALSVCLLAGSWTEFLVFASFLFPFYADEAVTVVERLWRGESLLAPHRRHLYQFLANERGVAHWKVTALYAVIQIFVALLVVAAGRHGAWHVLGIDAAAFGLWAWTHYSLKRRYVVDQGAR